MARPLRNTPGGYVYHVLNRGIAKLSLFEKPEDYIAFLRVVSETQRRIDCRILCYCLMPNHWHFLLWPREDGQLSEFLRLMTVTHVQRWHAHYESVGYGSIYQGRFKSFPVKDDRHLLVAARYVERNALRANLVERAECWPWSSLSNERLEWKPNLSEWPIRRPRNWRQWVNKAESSTELEALRRSATKGAPFGDAEWMGSTAKLLSIESALRDRGRQAIQK